MFHVRTSVVLLAASATLALPALTGCGGPGYHKTGVTRTLPALSGLGLADARSTATAAGFTHLTVRDATGSRRVPAGGDPGWKVCSQKPRTGPSDTGVPVKLAVVQLSETCPVEGTSSASPTATSSRHSSTYRPSTRYRRAPSHRSRRH